MKAEAQTGHRSHVRSLGKVELDGYMILHRSSATVCCMPHACYQVCCSAGMKAKVVNWNSFHDPNPTKHIRAAQPILMGAER
jgi:hypothetical protein